MASTPRESTNREAICLVVESGTDVRLVEGLATRFRLTVAARHLADGAEISQRPRLPVEVLIGPGGRLAFAHWVWRLLRSRRPPPDAVIVQGYGAAALAANLTRPRATLPVLMLVCNPVEAYYRCRRSAGEVARPFRSRELRALQALARANARLGQRYIVLSRHLEEVVRSHGTALPVHVIPLYGVDTSTFAPSWVSKRELRARRGLPTRGSLLLCSSRLAPEKDHTTALRAFRQLLESGRDAWLLHRSGGHRRFATDALAQGVAGRVIASDAVHPHDELPLDYQAADVFVHASREEGLGFSPLEALACGVPVVAARVGGLCETIIDGRTGWTYPVGDAAALAAAVAAVLDDPQEAARRAAGGRELVKERYEADVVFHQITAVVREVVARSRTGGHQMSGGSC